MINEKILKNKEILYIAVFNICLFIIVYFTCIPRSFGDDDWGIANYFVGVWGREFATPYNKFVSIVLGWIMYALYQVLPVLNWFVIVEELIVLASFCVFQWILTDRLKQKVGVFRALAFSSVIMVAIEPGFLSYTQFSQSAAIGCMAGLLLILHNSDEKKTGRLVFGVALVFISALYRPACLMLVTPYIGVCVIKKLFEEKELIKKDSRGFFIKYRQTLLSFLFFVGLYIFISTLNTGIYNSEYYSDYNSFNSARANVVDYQMLPYDDIAEELEDLGVSRNDYDLISSWTFADRSYITAELLNNIAGLRPKNHVDVREGIRSYFTNLVPIDMRYNHLYYLTIVIFVLCMLIDFRHMIILAPVLGIGTTFIEIYFTVIVARYPTYVRSGVLLSCIMSALYVVDFRKLRMLQNIKKDRLTSLLICGILLVVLVPLGNRYYFMTRETFEYDMTGLETYEYLNSRENDIFIIPTDSGGLHSLRDSYNIFRATKPGIYHHIIGLGGWSTNYPLQNEAYGSWGIEYPLRQVADEDVYVISSYNYIRKLQQYLLEHSETETSDSLVEVVNDATIYKITPSEIEFSKNMGIKIAQADITNDETYYTTDISLDIEVPKELIDEKLQVYISLEDEDQNVRFFMVYGGNNMIFSDATQHVTAKIPVDEISDHESYAVNMVVKSEQGFIGNVNDSVQITIDNQL